MSMLMKKIFTVNYFPIWIVLILARPSVGIGQSTSGLDISKDNIGWNAVNAVNQSNTQDAFTYTGSFVTYGNQKMDWRQKNGSKVYSYSVSSIEGTWQNLNQDGQLVFHLQNSTVNGTATFARVSGQVTVHLKLYVKGNADTDYVFSIGSITKL